MSNPLSREFRRTINKMKDTPQRKDYHPEIWVWDHEAYVYYNIFKNLKNFDSQIKKELFYTAFFHDIGKVDKTFYREDKECYVSYGHEKAALPYFDVVKNAVIPDNLRNEVIRFLVEEHMKPKFMNDMNESTIQELKNKACEMGDQIWDVLHRFSELDDMRLFFQNTTEEDRVEAKYRFNSFCNKVLNSIDEFYSDYTGERGDLFLIRGAPGSGKTTVANILSDKGASIVAADDYFTDDEGNYNFDKSELSDAHDYCKKTAEKYLKHGDGLVCVHNTFVKQWEMMDYFHLSTKYNYKVHTLITENRHESKSVHSISSEKVEEKREKFEFKL